MAALPLLAWVIAAPASGDPPTALGPAFQVNSSGTPASMPALAGDAAGNEIIVWEDSSGNDSIQGRRYDAAGDPIGGQFQVNSSDLGAYQAQDPDVAAAPDGRFVVTWWGSSAGIRARQFDASGAAVAPDFQVNASAYSAQRPAVGVDDGGGFVVAWQSDGSAGGDNSGKSIQARLFDAAGVALTGDFQVNDSITGDQYFPDVTAHDDGSFVVVWQNGNSGQDIQARRFDASGTALAPQFQVNNAAGASDEYARIASTSDGGFIVAWSQFFVSSARRFGPDGAPLGNQFQVNDGTSYYERYPDVDVGPQDEFVVVWSAYPDALRGRLFDSAGDPFPEFDVALNSVPDVAYTADGRFTVGWFSPSRINARRYVGLLIPQIPLLPAAGMAALFAMLLGLGWRARRRGPA